MIFCPACNSTEYQEFVGKEMMFGIGGNFQYLSCNNCQAIWIKNLPKNLESYYPKNYYAFGKNFRDSKIKSIFKKIRYNFFQKGINIKPPIYFFGLRIWK